jgi:hypothetical protein
MDCVDGASFTARLLRHVFMHVFRYTSSTGRPKSHIGWMLFENDIQTVMFKVSLFKLTWRPELNWARTASLEAWPFGNILMLLMKPPTAQGGNALSFPH